MWAIALAPVLFWVRSAWHAQTNEAAFFSLTKEDGLIENAQAIVFLSDALVAASIAWVFRVRQRAGWAVVYGVVAIGLLWVAGEEISWGQRLFGIETVD